MFLRVMATGPGVSCRARRRGWLRRAEAKSTHTNSCQRRMAARLSGPAAGKQNRRRPRERRAALSHTGSCVRGRGRARAAPTDAVSSLGDGGGRLAARACARRLTGRLSVFVVHACLGPRACASAACLPLVCRETLDVNADNRLPASHRFLFLVNSLLISAAVVYLYSEIFDMIVEENVVVFGAVSVVSAVMLTMACQSRAKKLIARLISKRGIELQVFARHRHLHLPPARASDLHMPAGGPS